jgi:DNA-binding NarL/FixJ family response regulator
MRILIVDDHAVVRRGLRALLETQAGWEICGEAENGRQAVEEVKRLSPDVVLIDMNMPEMNGLEATREIRKTAHETEVLMISVHNSEEFMRAAEAAGARGYVTKALQPGELLAGVESVAQHRSFFPALRDLKPPMFANN